MATVQTSPLLASPRPEPTISAFPWRLVGVGVILLAASLPLLIQFGQQLWLRPHYQFFPLVLLGAAVLAWTRLRRLGPLRPGQGVLSGVFLALAWSLLALAEGLDSSWLAAVASLILLAAVLFALGGWQLFRQALPAWLLLWVAVPPPLELDRNLILWLQSLTAGWSSTVLDFLGIYHVMAGNVVEIDARRLLVEEACSGVNSLFSVLACTLFLVFLSRRPALRACLLLVAAVGWVLAANVARVVGVVALATRGGIDLTSGWRHDAFGLLLFAVAVGLIWSTDQLLLFLAAPEGGSTADRDSTLEAAPTKIAPPGATVVWLIAMPYLALIVFHLSLYGMSEGNTTPTGAVVLSLDALDADTLPAQVGPWQRREFAAQTRNPGSAFGEISQTWTYQWVGKIAQFSLDYPFPGWHDLTRCYTGQGWRREDQVVHAGGSEGTVETGWVEVQLSKPAYRSGYLLFSQCDQHGIALPPRRGGAYLSLYRHESAFRRWGLTETAAGDPPPPTYQMQLFVEQYAPLTAEQQNQAQLLFQKAQQTLRHRWQREQ